jgi:peptide alpha-N-acetyltransferase
VRLLNRLDRAAEALPDLEKLIDINPENTEYYAGLLDAHALPRRAADRSAAQEAALDALYARLAVAYPRCSAVQRTLLDWKEGEAFLRAADSYARRFIQSGIPSLFTDLKPLYADDAKRAALEGLMLGYLEALQADGRLPPPPRRRRQRRAQRQ